MALRTITYQSLLRGASALGGVKYNQMLKETNALLFEYINMALRKGIEGDWWPEYTVVEERYWRDGLWTSGTYPDGTIIYYDTDEVYYENTSGGATSETPSATASDWTEASDFEYYVSMTQMTGTNLATAQTEIDAVKNIYDEDPRQNSTGGYTPIITNNGVQPPIGYDGATVFIEFRSRQDDMSGMVEWDADDTYLVGEYIYYKGTSRAGEAYKVTVNTSAGEDPEDTASSFSQVSMPYLLSTFIKYQALADWLGAGGGGSALGDTQAAVQLQNYLQGKADRALENESWNLRARSAQLTPYGVRN